MTCADPKIVQATGIHGITFYKDMIFDANNEGPKKATRTNIDKYQNLPCFVSKIQQRKIEPKAKQLHITAYKCFRAPKKAKRVHKQAEL